jgi:hypothetical protein
MFRPDATPSDHRFLGGVMPDGYGNPQLSKRTPCGSSGRGSKDDTCLSPINATE